MEKLCILFVLALICNESVSMTLRQKRQATNNGPTTPAATTPAGYDTCFKTCSVTPEYYPVCGSDNVTYQNIGKFSCAQACGANITLKRNSPCANTLAVS